MPICKNGLAGAALNVIPPKVLIGGTVRTLQKSSADPSSKTIRASPLRISSRTRRNLHIRLPRRVPSNLQPRTVCQHSHIHSRRSWLARTISYFQCLRSLEARISDTIRRKFRRASSWVGAGNEEKRHCKYVSPPSVRH